tara:strand:+ start:311 stop:502 length:192 start_codon:yes stop_codon:yes gene_type:complete
VARLVYGKECEEPGKPLEVPQKATGAMTQVPRNSGDFLGKGIKTITLDGETIKKFQNLQQLDV